MSAPANPLAALAAGACGGLHRRVLAKDAEQRAWKDLWDREGPLGIAGRPHGTDFFFLTAATASPLPLLPAPEATARSASASAAPPAGNESAALDRRVEEALACPCVADLRDGPCGPSFVNAFSCFLRAQAGPPDPAGVAAPACLPAFKALQACMVRHPEAFTDFVQSKDKSDALFDAAAGAGNDGNGKNGDGG